MSNFQQYGAPSVAQQALYDQFAHMAKGETLPPADQTADLLIQLQYQLIEQRNESNKQTALLMQMVQNQASALKEHMVGVQQQLIAIDENNAKRLQESLDEIREYQATVNPLTKEHRKQQLEEKMRKQRLEQQVKMQQDTRMTAEALAQEPTVMYPVREAVTMRTNGALLTLNKGLQPVPVSIVQRWMEGQDEQEHLQNLRGVLNANGENELVKLGQNPLAIYSLDNQLRRRKK